MQVHLIESTIRDREQQQLRATIGGRLGGKTHLFQRLIFMARPVHWLAHTVHF
jgi:hypothetical protein